MDRIRINFGADFCGCVECVICFANAQSERASTSATLGSLLSLPAKLQEEPQTAYEGDVTPQIEYEAAEPVGQLLMKD